MKLHQADSMWVVIGKDTPWINELAPPTVPNDQVTVIEPLAAKKAQVKWVKEDDAGAIIFTDAFDNERRFLEVTDIEEMVEDQHKLVLVIGQFTATQLSADDIESYRIVGFVSGLVPAEGHEEDEYLEAADVEDWGIVEALDYDKVQNVTSNTIFQLHKIFQY